MIELRQADYNPDELAWEVIVAITDLLKGGAMKWGDEYERYLDMDRELYRRVTTDWPPRREDQDEWAGAESGWRDLGTEFGIEVFDDGEGGYTYVGAAEEIMTMQEENV